MVEHDKVDELKDPISLLVHEIGAAGVVDEFRRQLEAYFHNEWPFNAPLQDGNTLVWWNMLLPHPHARVLAVSVCFLILAVTLTHSLFCRLSPSKFSQY
jgi:hypothetical protein